MRGGQTADVARSRVGGVRSSLAGARRRRKPKAGREARAVRASCEDTKSNSKRSEVTWFASLMGAPGSNPHDRRLGQVFASLTEAK